MIIKNDPLMRYFKLTHGNLKFKDNTFIALYCDFYSVDRMLNKFDLPSFF